MKRSDDTFCSCLSSQPAPLLFFLFTSSSLSSSSLLSLLYDLYRHQHFLTITSKDERSFMIQTYCYYLAMCVIDERVRGKEKIKFMARVALCCETALPVPRTFALQVPSLLHSDISTHAHTETLFCLSFYTSTSLSLLKTF